MAEGKTDSQATAELSEAARLDLLRLCSEQFAELQELQNAILYEPDSCEDEEVVSHLKATEDLLKQWRSAEPKALPSNSEVLVEAGIEEMVKLCSELQMVHSSYEAKRDTLRKIKELEEKWLENKKEIYNATVEHAEQLEKKKKTSSETSLLEDAKNDMQKMQAYLQTLMQCLGSVLEDHVPPIQIESTTNSEKDENISLKDILELLMNKALNSPHDPYVDIGDIRWMPYVELLLRYGIVVRHHENNFKVCLENF
ncbi:centromere protein K [Cynoglossus semilaevis]|uniref:Centromere protein K n=1 Tax=Cynoglossus semilaevis TaxID=244447 RepID=A0A3P8WF96_CYNSE|nr:centromere protein K [Cynoglossus semilaevis]